MGGDLLLRDVIEDDVPIFFAHQLDEDANWMAAFTAKDPADREAFTAKWARILGDDSVTIKTIVFDGDVAGSVLCWTDEEFGKPEVSYWIGKEHWGKGVATRALTQFLEHVQERPIYGRTAKDNVGSLRVLEKCGFTKVGADRGFANARGTEVEELVLELQ